MKKLLNNAVEEIMVRINNEIKEMRNELNIAMSVKAKFRIINRRKENINNLINKLDQLEKHMEKVLPEDYEEAKRIRFYIHKIDILLLDEFYIANKCY